MAKLTPYITCLLLLLLTALLHLYQQRKVLQIKRWQKSLHLQEHAHIFHQLYQTSNAFLLSHQARQGHDAMEYTYGEIDFFAFIALLSLINLNENTVFYDLGSGSGKAVIACGMVFPVRQSIGIELFPELYWHSCNQLKQLAALRQYARQAANISFRLGDFLEANLNDANIIFINATAFFGPGWEKLCTKLDKLPELHTVITTSKPLSSLHFTLSRHTKVKMSWGVVRAYIHQRKN